MAFLGCGAPQPQISLDEGPIVLVAEGTVARVAVDVNDPPESGACAPPFASDSFEIVIESGAALFDRLELESLQGGVELVAEPRCDAIAPGASDVLVPVTIRSRQGCAVEQQISIQIRDSRGPECAPLVRAWTGDCATVPATTALLLSIPSSASPPPICIRFEVRDPVAEDMWIKLAGSVPPELADTSGVLIDNPIDAAITLTVPVNDTTEIKGEFDVDYFVSLEAPGPGVTPATSGTIRLRVGSPGLAVSVPFMPGSATELDVTKIPVRLWRLDDPNPGDDLCLRATRATQVDPLTELERQKPFSRVENVLSGDDDSASVSGWVCGTTFSVSISPPLDAPPSETVRLEVNTCTGCTTTPVATGTTVTKDVVIDVNSVAEQMICDTTGTPTSSDTTVVCADIDGTATPEIVFVERSAGAQRVCVFAGDDAGHHQQVDLPPAQAGDIPDQMVAFLWRGPTGTPRPMIVGVFPGDELRVLGVTAANPPLASWLQAPAEMQIPAPLDLRAGVPIALDATLGATHYAIPSGRDVVLRCISSIAGCQTVTLSNVAALDHVITHIGRMHLDNDGIVDLVAFATAINPPNHMQAHAIKMGWASPGTPFSQGEASVQTNITGGPLRSGAINRNSCTPPCQQVLYAGGAAPDLVNQLLRVLPTATGPQAGTLSALSAVRDLASYRNRLIVGMEYGVSEAVPDGDLASWVVRDPVILEDRLVGPVTTQPLGYAGSVAPCVTAQKPSVAFTADTKTVRWTEMDIDVVVP